jgi:peptide subunit release factor 1 (eRF1)
MLELEPKLLETTIKGLIDIKPLIRGTTLITYIVPGSMESCLVMKHLNKEMANSNNIKSKQIKQSVINALKTLKSSYENFCVKAKTPKNGLVMLAGILDRPNFDKVPYYV